MMPFLGVLVSGLLLGSTNGTVLQGSKYPVLPLINAPFHNPATGGFVGLKNRQEYMLSPITVFLFQLINPFPT